MTYVRSSDFFLVSDAHTLAIYFAKRGWSPIHHPSALEQRTHVSSTVFGRTFDNPIGLGAGFDKDGEIIQEMLNLGFGFVEIGTVTPQPQPGNPKPRMFRLVEDFGIINRYGFNSAGSSVVKNNLREFRQRQKHPGESLHEEQSLLHSIWSTLYPPYNKQGVLGVNIGKNKTSEDAVADYVTGIETLGPYADYIVINISSPNTAGLRDLQQADALKTLLTACLKARDRVAPSSENAKEKSTSVPLLVKLAPDLSDEELRHVAQTCLVMGVDGIVVTNTTLQRPADLLSREAGEIGGLSGTPIKDRSTECIRNVFTATEGRLPIIGVGGIGSGKDAYEKLAAGASLVQVYSMMVYKGPGLISRIRHELAECMVQNGKRTLQDVVGSDHDEIYWKKRENKVQTLNDGKVFVDL